jgi:diguanylate cyclase (GGDEF)-like protein
MPSIEKAIQLLLILLSCASMATAAAPGILTDLQSIHALSNAEASKAIPVAFEATVTYYRSYEEVLFVQDGDASIYVQAPDTLAKVAPGDRVLIKGKTHDSYRPEVFASSITFLHHGQLPAPVPADFEKLIRGDDDSAFVKVHGIVRTADIARSNVAPIRHINLELETNGGVVHVNMDSDDENALRDLLDAEVDAVGVASGHFDGKMQLAGIDLNVFRLDDIHIVKHATVAPWSLSATPMDQVLSTYNEVSRSKRILVHGIITYYQPGSMLVLEDGPKTLRIMTSTYAPMRIGDLADATGFPDLVDGYLTLSSAEIKDSLVQAPLQIVQANWQELSTAANIFDLVSIEGRLVVKTREAVQDEYVIEADGGHIFTAIYRHPDPISQLALPPMKEIDQDSRVRVVGICLPYNADAFSGPVPFDILLRSFDDVSVVAKPSPFGRRQLAYIAGALMAILLIVGVRFWFVERGVRRQTASLGYIERRRSRILEDINGTRPLAEILEQITELVSFKLNGAPCWCQIADGAQLGNCPAKLSAFRVCEETVHSRSGSSLGVFHAAFDPRTKPHSLETEALGMATGLAALAIETRRLYNDLRRRSEFDLLTDTHNRFSLDKHLDNLIVDCRENAGIFGLIYIDLDEFKGINDIYGHHVGDQYLQDVAVRMKRQLRGHDLLARLGGDEFAVLVPLVRSRYEVEEIASRLVRSMDDPFNIEEYSIQGSASLGIAIYPEDGVSKDTLFKTADAAMYSSKNASRRGERVAMNHLDE